MKALLAISLLAVPAVARAQPEPAPDPVATQPATAPAVAHVEPVATPASTTASGFAIEVHLETSQVSIGTNSVLPTTQPGLFLGYRNAALTIGVGLDLTRLGQDNSGGGTSSNSSVTSFLIMPGVRVPLARADGGRLELLGSVDLGYGSLSQNGGTGTTSPPAVQHIRFQVGPGVRYWVTPSFAFGATAGLRYDRMSQSMDGVAGGPSSDQSTTDIALYSSLQLTGVF